VSSAQTITTNLYRAEGTAVTLGACHDASAFTPNTASVYAEPRSALFHAFMSAVPETCQGWDLIG
jgi:hypothetical protein